MEINNKRVSLKKSNDNQLKNKFIDPLKTIDGATRAKVNFKELKTLWFNTGTLCNLKCNNCYIESSPINDRLSFLNIKDVTDYLNEIKSSNLPTKEIGFTGGEPFVNPSIIELIEAPLIINLSSIILTNGMKPMLRHKKELMRLKECYGSLLKLRVSIDHYSEFLHSEERGNNTWKPMCDGIQWLNENGFKFNIAGRTRWDESTESLKSGYQKFFDTLYLPLDARNSDDLILFPEMDPHIDVPEITSECWEKLGVSENSMMCANSRMVVKPKETGKTVIMPCTLLAYQKEFQLGNKLSLAREPISLNHPNCSRFCVLGGGSCNSV